MSPRSDEETPLLQNGDTAHANGNGDKQLVELDEGDSEHPRSWSNRRKLANLGIIALMSILGPLSSSVLGPGITKIEASLDASETQIVACKTGFICVLGIGPLILAPLSEIFGRKKLYLICFSIFTLLQIPTALAPNVGSLIAVRTVTGFFGSISIANGGGTISDMYKPEQRAGIFGWYLLGPLLGPTLGPLMAGIIMSKLEWRWIFWVLAIICSVNVGLGFLFLKETYVPVLLAQKKAALEKESGKEYYFEGEEDLDLLGKLRAAITRPIRILFTQPVVLTMASYQALIFATTYSLYTQFEALFGSDSEYGFNTLQVGLIYLFPGVGFLVAVLFIVPKIDTVYNRLSEKHGSSQPEYRLPLANIGAVLIPISLFWFAWTVQFHAHWFVALFSTFFYGIGQVAILNTTQNYYIDAYEKYAASAIAAGALFRSLCGGIVPLMTPALLDKLGVGWSVSVFGFLGVLLAPSPVLFYFYGEGLRDQFKIEL